VIVDCSSFVENISTEIKNRMDIAVVGMSGGADSSLVTILCCKALGRENVYGVSMPYNKTDIETFNTRSTSLAERTGINHYIRPVTEIADSINEKIFLKSSKELTDINTGNSRSRARMCVLYGISHNLSVKFPGKRVRVAGTGNLSEDFIGYDTKGGDALADLFPIGDLFKSEVYQLLEYFRNSGFIEEEHIDRIPSAGLTDAQTDETDLGHSYDKMESAIRYCLQNYGEMYKKQIDDPIIKFVWERHKAHKHKHEAPPVIKVRHLCK